MITMRMDEAWTWILSKTTREIMSETFSSEFGDIKIFNDHSRVADPPKRYGSSKIHCVSTIITIGDKYRMTIDISYDGLARYNINSTASDVRCRHIIYKVIEYAIDILRGRNVNLNFSIPDVYPDEGNVVQYPYTTVISAVMDAGILSEEKIKEALLYEEFPIDDLVILIYNMWKHENHKESLTCFSEKKLEEIIQQVINTQLDYEFQIYLSHLLREKRKDKTIGDIIDEKFNFDDE